VTQSSASRTESGLPARWRPSTRRAGEIAGLNVLNIVPEPVAAALHYEATGTGEDCTILVFDLGGGTFDTTVIAPHLGVARPPHAELD
jgi:molecular chaperone DnaK (HSP70)